MKSQELAREDLSKLLQQEGATPALRALLEASQEAPPSGNEAWQYALHLGRLLEGGLTPTGLRRLIEDGYLEQRIEKTEEGDRVRHFRPVKHLSLEGRVCFLLTAGGVPFVRSLLKAGPAEELADDTVVRAAAVRPRWSEGPGVLWWQKLVVRRVPQFATNLRLALASLEEQHWPLRGVDNPFDPRKKGRLQRLVETVNYLNQEQLETRIAFSVDDSRLRFLWRKLPDASPAATSTAAGDRSRKKVNRPRRKK